MYEDENLNFKNQHCSCVATPAAVELVPNLALKLGGKEVEFQFFPKMDIIQPSL